MPSQDDHYNGHEQHQTGRRLRNCAVGEGAAAGGIAEVGAPDVEIVGVDLVVGVSIGGEAAAGLAEHVAPYSVVCGVDHAIMVVVAGEFERGEDDLILVECASRAVMDQEGAEAIDRSQALPSGDVAEHADDAARRVQHGEGIAGGRHEAADERQFGVTRPKRRDERLRRLPTNAPKARVIDEPIYRF